MMTVTLSSLSDSLSGLRQVGQLGVRRLDCRRAMSDRLLKVCPQWSVTGSRSSSHEIGSCHTP